MGSPLDGPRVRPKSGAAKQLVVFLHGYGADGDDLIEIGRQWQALLPDAAFVAPHAPERCPGTSHGRQWFALTTRDPGERWRGVTEVRPTLEAFLDDELQQLSLHTSSLALVGFSQGTMLALHVGLRLRLAPAAIVGYSGVLVGPEHLREAGARTKKGGRPPILLVHGEADELIPVEALVASCDSLADAGIPTQWHLSLGIGHGIDAGGLEHGGLFVAQAFGLAGGAGVSRGR